MTAPSSLYIGLMSGTSLDGVDGVLADFAEFADNGGAIRTIAASFVPFDAALRADLMALQSCGANEIEREAIAANRIAHAYAACVAQLLPGATGPVRAIAAHGQTVRHRPELGFTRQTINPALLAELTGIDVIADFRSRDVAAGGQGAPLVPAYHAAQFGQPGQTRVVVNIGGIGNISVLHANGRVTGFDTGPGNALIDDWVMQHSGQRYDKNGDIAASGIVQTSVLTAMLDQPWFDAPPPKSLDRADFSSQSARGLSLADGAATLTAFTAETVRLGLGHVPPLARLLVTGGGRHNPTLMREIATRTGVQTVAVESVGWNGDALEAEAFAWMAVRSIAGKPISWPETTGVPMAMTGGRLG